jgi:hypothetical protein
MNIQHQIKRGCKHSWKWESINNILKSNNLTLLSNMFDRKGFLKPAFVFKLLEKLLTPRKLLGKSLWFSNFSLLLFTTSMEINLCQRNKQDLSGFVNFLWWGRHQLPYGAWERERIVNQRSWACFLDMPNNCNRNRGFKGSNPSKQFHINEAINRNVKVTKQF